MSIDKLNDKIRKLKNPSMIDFGVMQEHIPSYLLEEEGNFLRAYIRFCGEILDGLKELVPAVRFSFNDFALMGASGLTALKEVTEYADRLGYYVLLDGPAVLSPWGADRTAQALLSEQQYTCDGILISPYIGSDAIKPFASLCRETKKDLFVIVRSPNKSALELQDLLTGSRLVHVAAADLVNRFGESFVGKCGYSGLAALVSAGAPDAIKALRAGYDSMFFLVDGLDYPSGNFKNSSYAFDRLGHGAVVCAGPSVTAAWTETGSDGKDYVEACLAAAERMKKNITRYVTVL